MTQPHRAMALDEIEALPGPGTLTWRPVRSALGLSAFGTNAYTATEAGVDVVEPHTEDPRLGHEELYFVHTGIARFTIDGDTFDAPAGTYVFVPDTASHRYAVAQEAGTTVLSFGGPAVFEPSAWEWYFRAEALIDKGDLAGARTVLDEGLARHPQSTGMHLALASLGVAAGDPEAARTALDAAIALNPQRAGEARADPRLAPLFAEG
jgi:hypothetical protein